MWSRVNGGIAAVVWPHSYLEGTKKAAQRPSLTGSFMPPSFPFPVQISLFLRVSPTLSSFLPRPSPLLRWSFSIQGSVSVGSLPGAPSPGMLAWLRRSGPGPGLCSLSSGQLAEQLKGKHLGLWNQRHCSHFTCTICWILCHWWNGKMLLLYVSEWEWFQIIRSLQGV